MTAPGAADFRVEWSDTLANDWSITGVTQAAPVSLDSTREQVTATVPAGSVPARFLRLRITTP